MARHHADWINAYIEYSKHSEAPTRMHFWSAIAAVGGALRRRVWIDQYNYQYRANSYIILVAPPGVVSKSTTAGIAMKLLRQVPDVKFGPDIVTWPSLVTKFAEARQGFLIGDVMTTMSPLTLESSEFGNLLDPRDQGMVNLLIDLWDGKTGSLEKSTKSSGSDSVENPWINLIACTTPSWIAGNFPEYMMGGGFISRAIFVYAGAKQQRMAYPRRSMPEDMEAKAQLLVDDLTHISHLAGEYTLTPDAEAYGTKLYDYLEDFKPANLVGDRFGGYLARKFAHIHKVALILACSQGDEPCIQKEHLETAYTMLTDLEPDMAEVFSKLGKSESSFHADKLIDFVHRLGSVSFQDAYRHVHTHFPSMRDFDDTLTGCVRAGFIKLEGGGPTTTLKAGRPREVSVG